ncbi:CdaR family transcriptional regulator [Nocardiopsis coralliicola]
MADARPPGGGEAALLLTADLAQSVVDEVAGRLRYRAQIIDRDGIILASVDRDRIGRRHQGGRWVLAHRAPLIVTPADAEHLEGTRPGVNLPLEVEGSLVGVLGVSGPPAEVAPVGELLAMAVQLLISQRLTAQDAEWLARVHRQLVADLYRQEVDEAGWTARLATVGPRLAAPYTLIALDLRDAPPASASSAARALQPLRSSSVVAEDLAGAVWVVTSPQHRGRAEGVLQRIRDAAGSGAGPVVAGGDQPGFAALAAAAGRIAAALSLPVPLPGSGEAAGLQALELPALLARAPAADRSAMAARVLDGIGPAQRATLRAFFATDLSASAAARQLHTHRNTVLYRLDQIARRSGYDPRRFTDAATLAAALAFAPDH